MGKGDFNRGRVQIFSISGISAQNCPSGVTGIGNCLGVMGSAAVIVVPGARLEHNRPTIPFRIEVAA